MNQFGGFPLLTLVVFLPGLGAIVAALIPAERRQAWRWLAFLIASANLFISLFLYMGWVNDPGGGLQFVDGPLDWVPSLGIQYHLGVDGISIHLVMLVTFLTPLVLLLVWTHNSRAQVVWILLFQVGLLGALVAFDLILFFAFWLLARLTTFLLLGNDAWLAGRTDPVQARVRFLIATSAAVIIMLVVWVGLLVQRSSLNLPELLAEPLGQQAQIWMFWCMVVAMGLSSIVFAPLTASSATQVLTSGLLVNLGGYGLLRFGISLFPLAATNLAPSMIVLGLAIFFYGAVAAGAGSSLNRTLVYWNMSQTGLALAGLFSLQNLGIYGAIMSQVGRSLGTAVLLMLAQPKAISKSHPTFVAISMAFLSLLGVPGLAGFVGQSALAMGILNWRWQASASAAIDNLLGWGLYGAVALGLVIGTWALFGVWRRLWGDPAAVSVAAAPSSKAWIALPVLVLLLVVGLHPRPFSNVVGPSVHRLLSDVADGAQRSLLDAQPGSSETGDVPLNPKESPPREQSVFPHETAMYGKARGTVPFARLSVSNRQVSNRCPHLSAALF